MTILACLVLSACCVGTLVAIAAAIQRDLKAMDELRKEWLEDFEEKILARLEEEDGP